VFLAKDLRLDRPVAMKVILHRRRGAEDLELLLEREAKLGASLNHKGIAAVYDFGFHGDKSYTVFEYVEGETLRQLIRRRGRIPLEEALPIAYDLAAALDFAHIHGVVHRDLKPENISFTKSGEFKILDLGLARDIKRDFETGTYAGTPAYSSPEQAACRPTDGKSDQYALALIVFEMLTGRKAFVGTDPLDLLREPGLGRAGDPASAKQESQRSVCELPGIHPRTGRDRRRRS
jgi:serine/threonine-protein kinase